jgi:hypothetical protein
MLKSKKECRGCMSKGFMEINFEGVLGIEKKRENREERRKEEIRMKNKKEGRMKKEERENEGEERR